RDRPRGRPDRTRRGGAGQHRPRPHAAAGGDPRGSQPPGPADAGRGRAPGPRPPAHSLRPAPAGPPQGGRLAAAPTAGGRVSAAGGGPVTRPLVVAVDGPAGAGQSAVSRRVAGARGGPFADSGLCYRAVAWLALEEGVA